MMLPWMLMVRGPKLKNFHIPLLKHSDFPEEKVLSVAIGIQNSKKGVSRAESDSQHGSRGL